MDIGKFRSSFVPHDLRTPLVGAADGPLAGLSVAVKDMFDIAGERTGGGNPQWLAAQAPASQTSAAVAKLLAAGATVIGKTICEEFFYSLTGANAHYGTPANLRAAGRLPGGSSSGSAAAAAAGLCDFALGSDTGGSVRIPASLCGLYGIRPTLGRVDLTGAMAMAPSFDVAGWFAQGPGVFRRVGQVLLEAPTAPIPIAQIIRLDDAFAEADEAVTRLLDFALSNMNAVLPPMTNDCASETSLGEWLEGFRTIQAYEVWQTYGAFVTKHQVKLGPGIRERFDWASKVTATQVEGAVPIKEQAKRRIEALARPGTILVLPTAPSISPKVDAPADELDSWRSRTLRLTCIAGMSGHPQITVPVGNVNGCPLGLSFIGWRGADETLLALAQTLSPFLGVYLNN